MTENEKAATFIGWPDGDWKSAGGKFFWMANDPQKRPIPDMNDPRNYMKALQELEFRHPWKVEFHIDADHYEFVFFMPNVSADGDGTFFRYTPRRARNMNESFAEALAALYDAEHPTESR